MAAAKEKKSTRTITTPIGIVCFAQVFNPKRFQPGQDAKYSMLLVFNKEKIKADKAWLALRNAVQTAAVEKFGADEAKKLAARGKLTLPWRDGAEYEEYGEPFSDKTVMLKLSSTAAPGIVNGALRPILDDSEFYSGCMARATAAVWPYDTAGNKGVTLLLNNIQKTADGERLAGSKRAAEEDFDATEEGGGEDDDEF
jgi:hypothetical protein